MRVGMFFVRGSRGFEPGKPRTAPARAAALEDALSARPVIVDCAHADAAAGIEARLSAGSDVVVRGVTPEGTPRLLVGGLSLGEVRDTLAGHADVCAVELAPSGPLLAGRLLGNPGPIAITDSRGQTRSIGGREIAIFAGPCSVEDRGMLLETAHAVAEAGATFLRGGAYKPRTSPYSFQGLGTKGLELLAEASAASGLPVVTEVMAPEDVDVVGAHAAILQVGTRNMQNYSLLKALAKQDKPVFLKRGLSSTLDEWLLAAEYIMARGTARVMLCERGIRTFAKHARFTFDINALPALKARSVLPIVADPAHATGHAHMVAPIAMGAVAAGADGVMVEVHPRPSEALSDGPQSLDFAGFADLVKQVRRVAAAVDRA